MSCLGCAEDDGIKEQKRQNEMIDERLREEKKARGAQYKLLLLGSAGSGKSTLVKQLEFLYKNGLSERERKQKLLDIKANIRDIVITIAKAMCELKPPVSLENAENERHIKYLRSDEVMQPNYDFPNEFFVAVSALWSDPGMQACFARSNEYQLIDSAAYFMDPEKLAQVSKPGYLPNDQDIQQCHVTSGITEIKFVFKSVQIHIIDVHGQSMERRRWMRCFGGITAIIFVVACSNFDMVIGEDPYTNQLKESIDLFDKIWNDRWLQTVSVILFLNKQDILKEKVDNGKKVEDYFPEFSSYQLQEMRDEEEPRDASSTFLKASNFFRDQFLQVCSKSHSTSHWCYPHFTTSVDTRNVRRIFDSCRECVLESLIQSFHEEECSCL